MEREENSMQNFIEKELNKIMKTLCPAEHVNSGKNAASAAQTTKELVMKMILIVLIVAAFVSAGTFFGCSEEKREKLLNAISDTIRPEEKGPGTPDIVAKQQRREQARQNRTWTPENQAKYPVEYCQAQLEKLDEHATALEAGMHKINIAAGDCRRKIAEGDARLTALNAFLDMAKAKYREADAKDAFPVDFNGYMLSRQQAQEKIVQAGRQIPELKKQQLVRRNLLGQLDKKKTALAAEQTRAAELRERVQRTIGDLQTKKVIDGNQNIVAVLNSLSDSVDSLGGSANDPSLGDIITPTAEASTKAEFDAIMGEKK